MHDFTQLVEDIHFFEEVHENYYPSYTGTVHPLSIIGYLLDEISKLREEVEELKSSQK